LTPHSIKITAVDISQ